MATRHPLRARMEAAVRARGLTLAAYARQIGVTRARVAQIANGQALPSLPLALRMSQDLGIPIEAFADAESARVWRHSA